MVSSCRRSKMHEEAMDGLVDLAVANLVIDRPAAKRALGIILDFLATEGPADTVQGLLGRLPGADEAIASARAEGGGGVFAGGGGIMGVGSRLMSAGLDMGEIQGVTRELIAYARDKAGDRDVEA